MGLVKIHSRPQKIFIAESAGWDHPERTEVGTRVDVSKQSQSSGDPKGRHLFLYITAQVRLPYSTVRRFLFSSPIVPVNYPLPFSTRYPCPEKPFPVKENASLTL